MLLAFKRGRGQLVLRSKYIMQMLIRVRACDLPYRRLAPLARRATLDRKLVLGKFRCGTEMSFLFTTHRETWSFLPMQLKYLLHRVIVAVNTTRQCTFAAGAIAASVGNIVPA